MMEMFGQKFIPCCVCLLVFAMLNGCANTTQTQHFEALGPPDPVTGQRLPTYYRMTIKGRGTWVSQYNLRAAYVSAVTVDSFNGKLPTIPAADLSKENEDAFNERKTAFKELVKHREQELKTYREKQGHRSDEDFEEDLKQQAYLIWLSSLSDTDLASLGQQRTTDPYQFRKLVFYTSATVVDLREYEATLSSAINKTATLARRFKHDAQAIAAPRAPLAVDITAEGNTAKLTWKNPDTSDHAGVLIVRRPADADPVTPSPGTEYQQGNTLGDPESENTVVASFNGNTIVDQGDHLKIGEKYAFDLYSFNSTHIYSPAATAFAKPTPPVAKPPAVTDLTMTLTPNQANTQTTVTLTYNIPNNFGLNVVVLAGKSTISMENNKPPNPQDNKYAVIPITHGAASESNLTNDGTTRTYTVYTVDQNWVYSDPVSIVAQLPAAPAGGDASDGTDTTDTTNTTNTTNTGGAAGEP